MNIASPTDFTLAFLREILPNNVKHIIEVGCGDGELASRLQQDGVVVTALDHDEDAVGAAQSRGVHAECADWLNWQPWAADVVLFTRSLHHLDDVERALSLAVECVDPGGMIIAEDFAFSETSASTAIWLKKQAQSIQNKTKKKPKPGSFAEIVLAADDPLAAWHGDHHHIHPASVMEKAFAEVDAEFTSTPCPYLFRYLVSAFELPPGLDCAELLEAEQRAIEDGDILAIGRRFIAMVY